VNLVGLAPKLSAWKTRILYQDHQIFTFVNVTEKCG